ncbi:MAG: hypothetical protein ACRC6I_10505, partial [Paracoccaceae bacterium]
MTPADLQGHWRRNWLRAPGFEDATTRVHWVQAGDWCADIRVPLIRPALDAGSLSAMAPADLAVLLSAEGFAGHTMLAGNVCTWHRDWNWRGFPCPVDAGTLWFDPAGRLIEDGVHADYREEWQAVAGGAWAALSVKAEGAEGLLIGNGAQFLLGLGQGNAPAWAGLAAALCDGTAAAAEAEAAFASVYVMGRWQGATGIADLSTQPFCEGKAVLQRDRAGARLTLPDFHGQTQEH